MRYHRILLPSVISLFIAIQAAFCCCAYAEYKEVSQHSCCDDENKKTGVPANNECCTDCLLKENFSSVLIKNDIFSPDPYKQLTEFRNNYLNKTAIHEYNLKPKLLAPDINNNFFQLNFIKLSPVKPRAPPLSFT